MNQPLQVPSEPSTGPAPNRGASARLFIFDAGWQTAVKADSLREFCTAMAPGQDYYHSLLANEIYVHHGTEKLCLACAIRRGVVAFEAKRLREAVVVPSSGTEAIPIDVDLGGPGQDAADRSAPLL